MIDEVVQSLIDALGVDKVLLDSELSSRYSHIWKMSESLDAKAVVLPTNTVEVSSIMKICHQAGQSVVIHGGLTNLVGGTDALASDIVLSLEKMNQILEIDPLSRTATVESGVILENIHTAVQDQKLLFPLSFGAKGSAQIGGIVASNAGGLRVLRYGMTRNLVLGLEAVLADGTIISSIKKIIKDNSAYDLKQLFIGSEGTLGVITKVVLKLTEAPTSRCSAFVALDTYAQVINFLKYIDQGLAGLLSGFELIWPDTYVCMTDPTDVNCPIPKGNNYYVLLESLGSDQAKDQEKLEQLLATALEKELILDAVPAQTKSDLNWFWKIREDVHVIKSACTYDHHFDISLPIAAIGEYVDKTVEKLSALPFVNAVYTFGHVADGNIHFIVDRNNTTVESINTINDIVYSPLKNLNGSVSAEHGIGTHKRAYLKFSRTEQELALMKMLKQTMDPKRILNVRNIFE